ncbi:uncharacterized protein Dwil_GK25680 [Drosophila willistoni]|uniref:Uncharacterized protein n=1 Tax=Drosophila willistoni TaxID=7260 RepID=B4NEQ2_DROWI|nr:uncharacterized protein LOC6649249 [Drosophila willistoni]EDW82221.1 uncharacterized protein Dwil_GK25680 [Drosophila willistoni]
MASHVTVGKWQVTPSYPLVVDLDSDIDSQTEDEEISDNSIDARSCQGHFGYAEVGIMSIPYIFRQSEKYCSVRIFESKVLSFFFNCLHQNICLTGPIVTSWSLTKAEARLFNEINVEHCNGEYGNDLFTQEDLIVHISDAIAFYQYLNNSYNLLRTSRATEKCGFVELNLESVVPYVWRNKTRVVPLFYFEGKVDLKCHADRLVGWDLAYMKCCCIIQGIRECFFSGDLLVLPLDIVMSLFPEGTQIKPFSLNQVERFLLRMPTCEEESITEYLPFVWHAQVDDEIDGEPI